MKQCTWFLCGHLFEVSQLQHKCEYLQSYKPKRILYGESIVRPAFVNYLLIKKLITDSEMINLGCLGWFSFCLWSLDEENNRTIMWEGWRGRAEEEEQVVIMMNEMMAHWPSNAAASLPVGVSCPTTTVRPCLIHTHTHSHFSLCLTHQAFLLSLTSHPFLLLVLPSVLSLAPVVPALHVMTTDRNKAPLVEFAKNC